MSEVLPLFHLKASLNCTPYLQIWQNFPDAINKMCLKILKIIVKREIQIDLECTIRNWSTVLINQKPGNDFKSILAENETEMSNHVGKGRTAIVH